MAQSNAVGVTALKRVCECQNLHRLKSELINSRRSLFSSRTISSSREPSPLVHFSTHISHVSSSSTNVHGRVQSNTIITSVCGRAVRGGKKCGNSDVYEGDAEGTVYTERRAIVSKRAKIRTTSTE